MLPAPVRVARLALELARRSPIDRHGRSLFLRSNAQNSGPNSQTSWAGAGLGIGTRPAKTPASAGAV